MKPEDLKNPDGLKSTQSEDEKSEMPAANEEIKMRRLLKKLTKEFLELLVVLPVRNRKK
jgi:hypothetical protein